MQTTAVALCSVAGRIDNACLHGTRRLGALAALVLTACGAEPGEVLPPPPDPPRPPAPVVDETAALFDTARVMRVEVTLPAEDWDALRRQTRTFVDVLGGADCLDEPFGSPFTYFVGRVTIDGEVVEQVGVRKKGFIGSLSEEHPSLKISFDEVVRGQRFSGFERMTLNNVQQDPSAIRQCLGYALYAKAGVPAPRCAYASVAVNGEELGVFAHVDSIKKRFLRRHFEDDSGDLWEGTLSDFRSSWNGTFEQKTDREVPASRARLEQLSAILESAEPNVLGATEPLVDLDRFFAYWATESLIGFWDGYGGNANNFFVYDDPTSQRMTFIPWGVDSAFVSSNPFLQGPQPASVMAQGILTNRVYTTDEGRARYVAEMRRVLSEVWDEDALAEEIDRLELLLRPYIERRQAGWADALNELRGFVRERRGAVEAELDRGGVDWDAPLRETICVASVGSVRASFETSFGTHPAPNVFQTGSGTFEVVLPQSTIVGSGTGSSSGFGTNDDDREDVVVLIVSALPDGAYGVVYLALDPAGVAPGARIAFDSVANRGFLLRIEQLGQAPQPIGALTDGAVTFEAGSPIDGTPVIGTIEAELFPL